MKVYYHGTARKYANTIIKSGFQRTTTSSYTGTGVNLTDSMTTAYEYGSYDDSGVVLKVYLKDNSNIANLNNQHSLSDDYFAENPDIDAASICGGFIVIVWNIEIVEKIELFSHLDAVKIMFREMATDGINMGYNGWVEDYRNLFFGDEPHNIPSKLENKLESLISECKNDMDINKWVQLPA